MTAPRCTLSTAKASTASTLRNAALTLLSTYSGGLGPVLQAPTPSGERYGEKRRVPQIRSSQQQKGGV